MTFIDNAVNQFPACFELCETELLPHGLLMASFVQHSSVFLKIYYYYFNLFRLCWVLAEPQGLLLAECGIQFPDQGSNPVLPALGAWSLNH